MVTPTNIEVVLDERLVGWRGLVGNTCSALPKLASDFSLDVSSEDAMRAGEKAVGSLGWKIASADLRRLEIAIPGGASSWASRISIAIAPADGRTMVTLDGKIGGVGPVQKGHLQRQMQRLQEAIAANVEGLRLRDCIFLGGHGFELRTGARCSLLFRSEDALLEPTGGDAVSFDYKHIDVVEIGGKGLMKSGGGFIGGGFGAEGALVGMGIASALNSLTSTKAIDTVINLKARDRQAWLRYPHETPEALRIRLAGELATIEAARREQDRAESQGQRSVSDELARLHDLHSQGALTDDEYSAAKARLIDRL
jgi:hypothetical protein